MTTITRERAQEIFLGNGPEPTAAEERELARIALASLEAEPVEPVWNATKYPISRPSPGAKLIVWDEVGKFIGYGSSVDTRESGVAIQMSDGRRFDSNHDLRWQYVLQPAPVAPDDVMAAIQKVARIRLDLNDFDGDKRGILDCLGDAEEALIEVVNRRAAMLHGANGTLTNEGTIQDGNSPVVPDGWVTCSERMPGSQEWVIVFAKWANQQVLCWDDFENRWTDFDDQSYVHDMFTHWMPLPAAPQQEAE